MAYRPVRGTVLYIGQHNDLLLGVVTNLLPAIHWDMLAGIFTIEASERTGLIIPLTVHASLRQFLITSAE
jgi:hypothetical protein